MKKRIICLLLAAMMVLSLTACKKADNDSLKYVKEKKTFILGLDANFAPMGFTDKNGKIVGFDIDLAKAVCKKLGVKLVTQPIDWDTKEQELNTKSIDCIWNGFSITDKNKKKLLMTPAYMKNEISLVVKKDSAIKSMADMAGKKLALQSASSAQQTLDSKENKKFKDSLGKTNLFSDYTTAMMDMESGNSDAVLMDTVMANYYITEQGKNYKVLSGTLLEDAYGIGFRKNDKTLCDAVWNALKELKKDGTVAKISIKWFGSDVTTIE